MDWRGYPAHVYRTVLTHTVCIPCTIHSLTQLTRSLPRTALLACRKKRMLEPWVPPLVTPDVFFLFLFRNPRRAGFLVYFSPPFPDRKKKGGGGIWCSCLYHTGTTQAPITSHHSPNYALQKTLRALKGCG